jgi:type IV fimbrial biogenesis protein FimT
MTMITQRMPRDRQSSHVSRNSHLEATKKSTRQQLGASLVDVLTGLGVAGTLAGLGAGIGGIIQSHATTAQVNDLIADLAFVRTTAINTRTTVTLCVSDNGESCSDTASWSSGWIIFTDENRNRRIDADDRLLRVQRKLAAGTYLQYGSGYYRYLMYNGSGMVFPGATFTFCGGNNYRRAIIVYWTGRPRISHQGPGGRALTCSAS